eukprot:7022415-Pyramimonas_sp.AAC.1
MFLDGLRDASLPPLSRAAGGSSVMLSYADQNGTSPSVGVRELKCVPTFEVCSGVQLSNALR